MLPALAAQQDTGTALVHIIDIKTHRFRNPSSSAVKDLKQSAIPQGGGSLFCTRPIQQASHFLNADRFRQSTGRGWWPDCASGVCAGKALAKREVVKSTNGDHGATSGTRGERHSICIPPPQVGEKVQQIQFRDCTQVGNGPRGAPRRVSHKITSVREDRIERQPTLDHKVIEIDRNHPLQLGRRLRFGVSHSVTVRDITSPQPAVTAHRLAQTSTDSVVT